jgi:PAS domain S-box-containing protein
MTEKIKILIVEDEALVAEDLKEMLQSLGYEIPGIADTGEGAITLAGEHQPGLVLMDINLAGVMDGITAGGEIRKKWGIPIIYVTAFATQAIIDRAKKTTPSGYILKPFNERQIQTAIEIALYNAAIERQLKERDDTIRTLLNATDNPSLLLDAQVTITAVNVAMAKRAQETIAHLIGTPFFDLLKRHAITEPLAETVRQAGLGKIARVEEHVGNIWYDSAVIPITDSQGIVRSIAVYCTDISHRKGAEIALKSLNDQLVTERHQLATLNAAMDSMDDPVVITDSAGIITYVNGAFKTRFSYTLPDVQGKHFSTLAAPENKFTVSVDGFVTDLKSVRTGKFIARSKPGLDLPFLLKSSPVFEDNRMRYRVIVLREEMSGGSCPSPNPITGS